MKAVWGLIGVVLTAAVGYLVYQRMNEQPAVQPSAADHDTAYRWLEDVEGDKALDWVRRQNQKTLDELRGDPRFAEMKEDALELVSDQERLPQVRIRGDYVYNLWRDDNAKRGLWRRMPWEDFIAGSDSWETVLDVDALAQQEGQSWVWQGATCLKPDYRRCLIYLSPGGSDAAHVREFDLVDKKFVVDGFQIPEAKTSVAWYDRDHLLVSTALFPDSQTDSGYGRRVQLWQRGEPLQKAPVLLEGEASDVSVRPFVLYDGSQQYTFLSRSVSFFRQQLHVFDGHAVQATGLPTHLNIEGLIQGQLIATLRESDFGYQQGDVIAIELAPLLADQTVTARRIFQPSARQAVSYISQTADDLLVFYLDDVQSKLARIEPVAKADQKVSWQQREVNLPGQGTLSLMSADEDSQRVLLSYQDFLTPPSLLQLAEGGLTTSVVRRQPARFETAGLEVDQAFATSADGTRVPYFIVTQSQRDGAAGPAPTLLYGYGGFEISLTPRYSATLGRLWLEQGGTYVLANIRGGGEYGPRWHQAALQENRQRAYDDFIAIAEDLISRGITSADRLSIEGGSNGGLLVGAVTMQRPELFKAVICQVPLLDMLRFHKLLAGASWMGEYGNPDVPEQAEYLRSYSPFHNVQRESSYPEMFFVTSTKDDRVHPGHARKMAAKMMDYGHKVYYFENIEGGHSASADLVQQAERTALEYTYLWRQLRPTLGH
jgi:prolyl oligopeptidase